MSAKEIITCDVCGYIYDDYVNGRRMSKGKLDLDPGPAFRFDVCYACISELGGQGFGRRLWNRIKSGFAPIDTKGEAGK